RVAKSGGQSGKAVLAFRTSAGVSSSTCSVYASWSKPRQLQSWVLDSGPILWLRDNKPEDPLAWRPRSHEMSPMRTDIVPGATFPDYELTDHTGKRRKLSELQGTDPLILILSRGSFCPKDRRQMEGLLQLHRELDVGYCRLVTVTTDNLLETYEF